MPPTPSMPTPLGSHRLTADELIADGHAVSERQTWRLCSPQGLFFTRPHRRRVRRRPPRRRIGRGRQMSPNTAALRASCISARPRTSPPTGTSAARSIGGRGPPWRWPQSRMPSHAAAAPQWPAVGARGISCAEGSSRGSSGPITDVHMGAGWRSSLRSSTRPSALGASGGRRGPRSRPNLQQTRPVFDADHPAPRSQGSTSPDTTRNSG